MANRIFLALAHSDDPNVSYSNDEELSFDVDVIPYLLRGYEWLRPAPWTK